MLRLRVFLAGLLLLTICCGSVAFAEEMERTLRLKNGLQVYVIKDTRFPIVCTRLYVRAGSASESPEEAGISHVLEHMVFKGTESRPKSGVAQDVESVGGYLNAGTSFEYTYYLTDMPAAQWRLGMDVVKDMAFHPLLDPQELEAEKEVIVAELKRSKDTPATELRKALQAFALKGTPYERPIIGFEPTIRSVTVQQMRNYITRYYQPQNMMLVVVGNVDVDEVLAEAEKLFGNFQNTSDMQVTMPLDPAALGTGVQVSMASGEWNTTHIGIAFPVPGDRELVSLDLDLLAYLLAGNETSYLTRKYMYEKQLVDAIQAKNMSLDGVGMFYITARLDSKKVQTFWKEFTADLASLQTKVFTAEELARAKLNIEDGIYRSKETLQRLASRKAYWTFFKGGDSAERNAIESLKRITVADLQVAWDAWIRPERLSAYALYPKNADMPDIKAILEASWKGTDAQPAPVVEKQNAGKAEIVSLEHGRTVVLIPDTTMPYTAVNLYMPGGDALVPPSKQGVPTLTARVLTTGTESYTAPQMQKYLADRAAHLSASGGRQLFSLSMSQPSRFNKELLPLFRDVMLAPAFSPEEVEREKKNQIAAIASRDERPLSFVFARLPSFLFPGGHPYGYAPLGTPEEVERYTTGDLRLFWERQIEQPWVVAVVGTFDREEILAWARTLAVPKKKGVVLSSPTWNTKHDLTLDLPGREQAHLLYVFKTVPVDNPDMPALKLLEEVLSGQSGILFRELRDNQSLGYTVTAINQTGEKTGYLMLYIGTSPDKISQAEKGFSAIMQQLQDRLLPKEELVAGCNQMETNYYREQQSLSSRAAEAARLTTLGRPITFDLDVIAKASKVTPQDMQNVIKKYLDVQNAYIVKVLP